MPLSQYSTKASSSCTWYTWIATSGCLHLSSPIAIWILVSVMHTHWLMCHSFVTALKATKWSLPSACLSLVQVLQLKGRGWHGSSQGESNCYKCLYFIASFECGFVWVDAAEAHISAPLLTHRIVDLPYAHLTSFAATRRYTATQNAPLKILIATLSDDGGLAVIMTRLRADICHTNAMLRLDYCYQSFTTSVLWLSSFFLKYFFLFPALCFKSGC